MKRSLEPFLLEIFLTNRCNMNCSYCASRHMIHEKEAKKLTFSQLKRAVDVISSDKYIHDKFNGQVRISFTGGEPLLEFELLKEAVSYIHTKEPDFNINVETNGTLLTKNRMDFFVRNDVGIGLSLDGYKRVNDLHRKFRNNEKKSAFESVMSNLEKGIINKRYMDHFHVVTILTPQTINSLPDVVKFFRHDVGFKQLEVGLESYEMWSRAGINRLRNVLRSLKSRFLTTFEHEADVKSMEFAFREFFFSHSKEPDYHELTGKAITLFYDGYFYPCDFVVKPPLERQYRVGDLRNGIDFKRIKTIASLPMFADISRKCEYTSGLLSPVERYYWGVIHKFNPRRMNKLLKSASQVNKVYTEEMDCYVRLQRIYERLVMTTSFGDFAHLPKYMSKKEIKSFCLIIRDDSNIAGLREDIDYFLYSPGSVKKLALDAMDNTQTSIDVMEGMVLYVLMKAGYLKKKIRLMVKIDTSASGGGWDADRRRYLSEHGVRVGIKERLKKIDIHHLNPQKSVKATIFNPFSRFFEVDLV